MYLHIQVWWLQFSIKKGSSYIPALTIGCWCHSCVLSYTSISLHLWISWRFNLARLILTLTQVIHFIDACISVKRHVGTRYWYSGDSIARFCIWQRHFWMLQHKLPGPSWESWSHSIHHICSSACQIWMCLLQTWFLYHFCIVDAPFGKARATLSTAACGGVKDTGKLSG